MAVSIVVPSMNSRYQKFFSNLLNWCETLCSVTGVSGQGIILVLVIPVNRVILIAGSSQSPLPSQSPQVSQSFHSSYVSQSQRHSPYPTHPIVILVTKVTIAMLVILVIPATPVISVILVITVTLVILINIGHEAQSSLVVQIIPVFQAIQSSV